MNVLKPDLQATIKTLLSKGIGQREIERKTGIDRKTIRRYAQTFNLRASQEAEDSKSPTEQDVATGSGEQAAQNPPPRPPARADQQIKIPHRGHRPWKPKFPSLHGRPANATGIGLRHR